jgi:hypothetical protein
MKTILAVLAAAAVLAACDRPTQPKTQPAASGSSAPAQPLPQTATGARPGAPTMDEKREGANPTQGQVDPKDASQHRDFQQQGDRAGPTSAETSPGSAR